MILNLRSFVTLDPSKFHLDFPQTREDLSPSANTSCSSPDIAIKRQKELKDGEVVSPARSNQMLSVLALQSEDSNCPPLSYREIVSEYYWDKYAKVDDWFVPKSSNSRTGLLYLKWLSQSLRDVKLIWSPKHYDYDRLRFPKITEDEIYYLDRVEEFLNFRLYAPP